MEPKDIPILEISCDKYADVRRPFSRSSGALGLQHHDDPDPVNLGAGFEITIRDLAEKIRLLVGSRAEIVWDTSKPDGQPRRCLDTTRAAERFGFRAQVDFDEGLRRTIEWYRAEGCTRRQHEET